MSHLWVAGSNCGGQLGFPSCRSISEFRCVETSGNLKVLYACSVYTVVQTLQTIADRAELKEHIYIYGHDAERSKIEVEFENEGDHFDSAFGDHGGYVGLLTKSGRLFTWAKEEDVSKENYIPQHSPLAISCLKSRASELRIHDNEQDLDQGTKVNDLEEPRYFAVAVAGNGMTCAVTKLTPDSSTLDVRQFSSAGHSWCGARNATKEAFYHPGSLLAWHVDAKEPANQPMLTWQIPLKRSSIRHVSLVANGIAFGLLVDSGEKTDVYTWGNELYPGLLGRELSADTPAGVPHPVSSLKGPFKIRKIDAGGLMMAAVSDLGDGWLWGLGSLPGCDENGERVNVKWTESVSQSEGDAEHLRKLVMPGASETSSEALEDSENELLDVAVGREHILVQDKVGVWASGLNRYHQYGGGASNTPEASSWQQIALGRDGVDARRSHICIGMKATAAASFIVTELE